MTPPTVFISYSHDSAEHKSWVLNLGTTLRDRGIDAVLDQWELKLGDDLPHFMETELARCDYVIVVCTKPYVIKANARTGGVGFENMILTASLLKNINYNKIIPIIRQASTTELPTFLKSKLYIDFSNDSEVEYKLDELQRRLLNAPLLEKPKLGLNPYKPFQETKPARVDLKDTGAASKVKLTSKKAAEIDPVYQKARAIIQSSSYQKARAMTQSSDYQKLIAMTQSSSYQETIARMESFKAFQKTAQTSDILQKMAQPSPVLQNHIDGAQPSHVPERVKEAKDSSSHIPKDNKDGNDQQ